MGINGLYPLVNKQLDPENHQHFEWKLVFQPRWLPGSMLIYQRVFESWSPNPRIGFSDSVALRNWSLEEQVVQIWRPEASLCRRPRVDPVWKPQKIGWVAGPRWLPSVDVVTLWHLGLSNGNTATVEGAPKDTSFFFFQRTQTLHGLYFFLCE